jgi:hypothetical protein
MLGIGSERGLATEQGKTASQSEHSNNHSGAHIQNTKHGEENYVHGGIICGMFLQSEA